MTQDPEHSPTVALTVFKSVCSVADMAQAEVKEVSGVANVGGGERSEFTADVQSGHVERKAGQTIDFSEESIIRFSAIRLQIDTDY